MKTLSTSLSIYIYVLQNMFATYRSCTMLQSVTAILIQRISLFFFFPNDALLGLESHVPRQTYRCHTAHPTPNGSASMYHGSIIILWSYN